MSEISAMSVLYEIKKDLRNEIDYKKNILFNTCVAINPSETKGYIDGLNFAMNSLKRNWNGVFFGDDQDPLAQEKIENQESVIDEIKAEIEKLDGMYVLRDHAFYAEKDPKHAGLWHVRLKEVIDILDRYRIGSEEVEEGGTE